MIPVHRLGVRLRRGGGVVHGLGERAGGRDGGDRGEPEGQGAKAAAVTATGGAVDPLWVAALCRSATRASGRARAMLSWCMVASWASAVLSSSSLEEGANRRPTARQQAAIHAGVESAYT